MMSCKNKVPLRDIKEDTDRIHQESQYPQEKAAGNVMIVDDEPATRSILANILSGEGHRTHTVSNGKAALTELAEKVYDLLIVDLKMLGMSRRKPYEILNEKSPDTANKIVFITGDTMNEETYDFLVSSERPYLAKPFNPNEIIDIVEKELATR